MKELNKKRLIAIMAVVDLVVIGIAIAASLFLLNREGVAVNSGTFSATSGGVGFSFGVQAGGRNGISKAEYR